LKAYICSEGVVADAGKRNEPIETVLMDDLNISKKDIGRSLSYFYKTPFEAYDETVLTPGELLAGLKVPFMRANAWVRAG